MKICLIRPPAVTNIGVKGQIPVPPLGLAYLVAALRTAEHEVVVLDAVGDAPNDYRLIPGFSNAVIQGLGIETIVSRIPPDTGLIGVSCMFSVEWPYNYLLIKAIKKRFADKSIVVGGEHVTACGEHLLEHYQSVDICALGEADETIVELCEVLAQNEDLKTVSGICYRQNERIYTNPRRKRIDDIDRLSEPDWSDFDIATYIEKDLTLGVSTGNSMPILASRGCPHRCAFCSSENMWTTRWRPRDPQNIISEMKKYITRYNADCFIFYDLTPIVGKRWIKKFTSALIAEDLQITWQMASGTRSESIDAEISQLLYRSGCRGLNLAPESGSPRLLNLYHKDLELDQLVEAIRQANNAGLQVKTNIIFGMPDETVKDALLTIRLIARMALAGARDMGAFIYSMYPGSEIFEIQRRKGKASFELSFFKKLLQFTDPQTKFAFQSTWTREK